MILCLDITQYRSCAFGVFSGVGLEGVGVLSS